MRPKLTLLDVFARIGAACRDAGGQKAWAMKHGIRPQYVSDVLNARREPGVSILNALGLRKHVRYAEARITDV